MAINKNPRGLLSWYNTGIRYRQYSVLLDAPLSRDDKGPLYTEVPSTQKIPPQVLVTKESMNRTYQKLKKEHMRNY